METHLHGKNIEGNMDFREHVSLVFPELLLELHQARKLLLIAEALQGVGQCLVVVLGVSARRVSNIHQSCLEPYNSAHAPQELFASPTREYGRELATPLSEPSEPRCSQYEIHWTSSTRHQARICAPCCHTAAWPCEAQCHLRH